MCSAKDAKVGEAPPGDSDWPRSMNQGKGEQLPVVARSAVTHGGHTCPHVSSGAILRHDVIAKVVALLPA
jgi:hypothetical protein